MTTIHYVARNKAALGFGIPLCSPRKDNLKVTEDKTLVTCSRCAKDLGITPAAKPESKNVMGTCACCFSNQKTQTKTANSSGTMFHHGYERPGNGYIEGACPGHDFLPYEKSCEGTKYMLERAQSALANTIAHIEDLKVCTSVTKYVVTGHEGSLHKRIDKGVSITLVKGEAPVVVECASYYGYKKTFTFEQVRDEYLHVQESRKSSIESDIKFYEKKIAEWKEN